MASPSALRKPIEQDILLLGSALAVSENIKDLLFPSEKKTEKKTELAQDTYNTISQFFSEVLEAIEDGSRERSPAYRKAASVFGSALRGVNHEATAEDIDEALEDLADILGSVAEEPIQIQGKQQKLLQLATFCDSLGELLHQDACKELNRQAALRFSRALPSC